MLKLLGTSYLLAALSVAEGYTTMGDVTIRTRNYSASFQSAQTAFGPRYGWRGYDLDGMVVLQTPRDPCYTADYRPASSVGDNDTMKIALLSNAVLGACSADTAVWAMQKAGYDGVIIFNPLNDLLYVLGGSGIVPAPILIPTVFVGISCGSVLAKYQAQSGVDVELKIDGWINLALYLIPLACVVGVCVIVIIIFLIARWCCEVRRRRRSRLSKSNLKKLPIIKFKSGRDVYETCAICLDDYENGDKLRVLPCKHAFHSACIDPWLLQQKRVCPCCKRRVMTSRGQPVVPQDVADSSDSSDTDDEHRPLLHAPASDAERRYLTPVYSDDQPTPDRASRDFWEAVNRARRRAEDAPIDESHEEYLSIPDISDGESTIYRDKLWFSVQYSDPIPSPDPRFAALLWGSPDRPQQSPSRPERTPPRRRLTARHNRTTRCNRHALSSPVSRPVRCFKCL